MTRGPYHIRRVEHPVEPTKNNAGSTTDWLTLCPAQSSAPFHLLHNDFIVRQHHHAKTGDLFAGQCWYDPGQRSIQGSNTFGKADLRVEETSDYLFRFALVYFDSALTLSVFDPCGPLIRVLISRPPAHLPPSGVLHCEHCAMIGCLLRSQVEPTLPMERTNHPSVGRNRRCNSIAEWNSPVATLDTRVVANVSALQPQALRSMISRFSHRSISPAPQSEPLRIRTYPPAITLGPVQDSNRKSPRLNPSAQSAE